MFEYALSCHTVNAQYGHEDFKHTFRADSHPAAIAQSETILANVERAWDVLRMDAIRLSCGGQTVSTLGDVKGVNA